MRAGSCSERTIADRINLIRRAVRATGEHPVEFTAPALAVFLASPRLGAGTRATYFGALRSWHRWLVLTSRRPDDPTVLLAKPKVPRRHPRPVSTPGLEVLLASGIRRRTRAMILLGAYQGLRVHEIAQVRGEDVDLIGQTLRVIGKGGVDALLPLHPLVAEVALTMPRTGWWFPAYEPNVSAPAGGGHVLPRSVSTTVGNAMRRAGVPGTAHALRHWFGTQLLRAGGANLREAQTLLRHASLQSTQIYTEVAPDDVRVPMGRLPVPGSARGREVS